MTLARAFRNWTLFLEINWLHRNQEIKNFISCEMVEIWNKNGQFWKLWTSSMNYDYDHWIAYENANSTYTAKLWILFCGLKVMDWRARQYD